MDSLSQFFERQYLWNKAINHITVFSLNNVILRALDIIYSDVIDSFISEILKYKSWILASWRKRSWTVRFTPCTVEVKHNCTVQICTSTPVEIFDSMQKIVIARTFGYYFICVHNGPCCHNSPFSFFPVILADLR